MSPFFMRRNSLLLFTLLFLSFFSKGQYTVSNELKLAHGDIFSLDFSSAATRINSFARNHPDDITIPYLRFTHLFVLHFVDENQEAFEADLSRMRDLIDEVADGDKSNPHYYLYAGEMNLELAALRAKYKNYWSAAQYGHSGLNLLETGAEKFPDFEPLLSGKGLLNVVFGSIPENYRSLAAFFGYEGDIELGMEYLKRSLELCLEKPEMAYLTEKNAFMYCYVQQQLYPDEVRSMEHYGVNPKSSPLLAFVEAKILSIQGENDKLIDLLSDVVAVEDRHSFPYLYYLLGRAKLARGDMDAYYPLYSYLTKNKGVFYIRSTHRYLYWHYSLAGNSTKAELHRKIAAEDGRVYVGADLEAQRECNSGSVSLPLLRARLAFDNGDYSQALQHLKAESGTICNTDLQFLEYHYRKGRCYQELGEERDAIASFRQAIKYHPSPMMFNRVNAELNLAYLLEKTNPQEAKLHYENVLDFEDYPWYDGSQQRAKTGLSRLED